MRVGDQQLVEIAKALSLKTDILIMDEPTSALTEAEVADIVAFLESLTGPFPDQQMPRLPPTPGDLID